MNQDTINQETGGDATADDKVENPETTANDQAGSEPQTTMQDNESSETDSAPADENVQTPDFNELVDDPEPGKGTADLNRLHEVKVTVAAELGKTNLPIQKILQLSEGSVIELNRSIDSPVELIAQGLPFANGEVVVVDEKFAIRIKELYSNS